MKLEKEETKLKWIRKKENELKINERNRIEKIKETKCGSLKQTKKSCS